MNNIKNLSKKAAIYFTIATTIFWSMGLSFLTPAQPASAATIIPSTIGLLNGNFAGAPIKASSNPTAIVKLAVSSSLASQTLQAVTVAFTTSPGTFATTTLANIAADATSGVALYNDAGSTASYYDGADVLVATSTGWIGATSNITLTPQPAISIGTATSTFYVVIRTSAAAANDYQIIATIPAPNGVVTSNGNGPATAFSANSFRVDTGLPTIHQRGRQ